jgi:hypothetical protein
LDEKKSKLVYIKWLSAFIPLSTEGIQRISYYLGGRGMPNGPLDW